MLHMNTNPIFAVAQITTPGAVQPPVAFASQAELTAWEEGPDGSMPGSESRTWFAAFGPLPKVSA